MVPTAAGPKRDEALPTMEISIPGEGIIIIIIIVIIILVVVIAVVEIDVTIAGSASTTGTRGGHIIVFVIVLVTRVAFHWNARP